MQIEVALALGVLLLGLTRVEVSAKKCRSCDGWQKKMVCARDGDGNQWEFANTCEMILYNCYNTDDEYKILNFGACPKPTTTSKAPMTTVKHGKWPSWKPATTTKKTPTTTKPSCHHRYHDDSSDE